MIRCWLGMFVMICLVCWMVVVIVVDVCIVCVGWVVVGYVGHCIDVYGCLGSYW